MDKRSPEVKAVVEARKAASEEEHPVASLAASGLGVAGSLAIPGPGIVGKAVEGAIGKAAATNLATKVGTAIVKNTAIAGAYNAPSVVANLAVGDPQTAAETLGTTLKYGPVLGLFDLGLGKMVPTVAKAISKVGVSPATQQEMTQQVINIATKNQGNARRMAQELAQNPALKKFFIDNPTLINSIVTNATDNVQRHKDTVDGQYDTLLRPNPAEISDTVFDSAQKLGQANLSPANPTGPFVNPAHVSTDLVQDLAKLDPDIITDPAVTEVKGILGEAGSSPIKNSGVDELRSKLEGLDEDHPMRDRTIQTLNDSQDRSLDFAMNQIGGEDLADYLHQKELAKYGDSFNQVRSLPEMAAEPTVPTSPAAEVSNYDKTWQVSRIIGNLASGHPVAAAANYVFGASSVRGLISKLMSSGVSLAKNSLMKIADEAPHLFGGSLARSLNEHMDAAIEKIPSILAGTAAAMERKDPLNSLLGGGSGLSQDQKYNKVADAIINANANPGSVSENYGQLLSLFASDPHLQNLIAQHNIKAISFLNTILPKNPNPPRPFTDKVWQPSKQQKNDFISQLAIVDNPMLAVHKIAAGTITLKDINTLRTVYPALADKILGKVNAYAFSPEAATAPTHQRVAISKATNTPLPSLNPTNINRNQAGFSQSTAPQNPNGSAPTPKHTNTSIKSGPSLQTEVSLRQYKGLE
jgi:hypothetical protein